MILVFIAWHERYEGAEAYADRLTAEQIEDIKDAPEGSLIRLEIGASTTRPSIFEEADV